MLYAFIGFLDDPSFSFEGGDWSGNIPRRRFPDSTSSMWAGYVIFNRIITRIEKRVYDGRQTDWGGFVARLSTQQLRDFVAELYKDNLDRLEDEKKAYEFIAALDPHKQYALVACEDDTEALVLVNR